MVYSFPKHTHTQNVFTYHKKDTNVTHLRLTKLFRVSFFQKRSLVKENPLLTQKNTDTKKHFSKNFMLILDIMLMITLNYFLQHMLYEKVTKFHLKYNLKGNFFFPSSVKRRNCTLHISVSRNDEKKVRKNFFHKFKSQFRIDRCNYFERC